MGKRLPNPRLAKIHRSYTVEETANQFGIHKNTVGNWIITACVNPSVNYDFKIGTKSHAQTSS